MVEKVAVTGALGFIGKNLSDKLKLMGYEVIRIDKNGGGITDYNMLRRYFRDVKTVYHLGAISGALYFDNIPYATRVNCEGTVNVLEAALKNNVERVIFSSTMSSYAFTPIPHKEDNTLNPINFYTATKMFGENACKLYSELHGLDTVTLRYASVYGTWEEHKKQVANPVTQFLWAMMKGKNPILYAKGVQERDLIFVDDIVNANIHVSKHGIPGEVYNVSTNISTTFNNIINIINMLLDTEISPEYAEFNGTGIQSKYVICQKADNSKLVATGWKPEITLEEGLRRCIEYYRDKI